MRSGVTLFEYQGYTYTSSEVDLFREGTLYLTDRTLARLEVLNEQRSFLEIGRSTIKPLNYVGVVRINGFTIQIFPKIFKDEKCPDYQSRIAGNLLKMLSYTSNIPLKEVDVAGLDLKKINLFEVFIYLFAKNLLHVIKDNQKKEYVRRSDDLRVIRGRINFRDHINPARMHIIPCRYYEFSVDNLMNQTLKYTCYLMARTISNFSTVRLLRSILNILDPVTLVPVSAADIDRITFSRLNRNFEPYIRMCKIFLANSSLTLQASKVESFSMLMPMEKLFEGFISALLSKNPIYFFGRSVPVQSQMCVGRFVRDEKDREFFKLRPDLIVGYPGIEAILDTKYKQLNGNDRKLGVSSADIYQMYAYATKAKARSCMLLYPEVFMEQKKNFILSVPSSDGLSIDVPLLIRAVRLSYDFNRQDEWRAFCRELQGIVRPLIEDPTSI